jgi:DUF4097 and DUF4098 domain-containing protein YvlB
MRTKWIVAIILGLALLALCAGIAIIGIFTLNAFSTSRVSLGPVNIAQPANVSASATEEKTFIVQAPATLVLNNTMGDIEVKAVQDSQQIQVTAQKTTWGVDQNAADTALQNLNVSIEQQDNQVTIKVEGQPATQVINNRTDRVDFTILVPSQTTTDLTTRFGKISLSGTQGKAALQADFGDVQVTDFSGGLSVESRNGNLSAERIHLLESGFGDVTLHSSFGKVSLSDVETQKVSLSSNNGAISLDGAKVQGDVDLNSDFGKINFTTGSAASLTVKTLNGDIALKDLAIDGLINAQSDFGDLTLTQAHGQNYTLTTKNGKISADAVQGTLTVSTDFGDVDLSGGQDATLNLTSRSGVLSYSGSLGAGPHLLSTNFGAINLQLPQDTPLNVDLMTKFGHIRSDLKITISTNELDQKHWTGTINGGGASLKAQTDNGDITISVLP